MNIRWLKDSTTNHKIEFGNFIFDSQRREIRRDGKKVDLKPQPLRLLEVLLTRAPETVSRETLQSELWGGKTIVEFEQGLNTCVAQLRLALGETAKNPVCIITEPKIGYKFVAQHRRSPAVKTKRKIFGLVAIIVLVLITVVTYSFYNKTSRSGPTIAVASDPRIHDIVLRARSLRKYGDVGALRESLAIFEDALQLYPNESVLLGGTALTLAVLAGREGFPTTQTYAQALSYSEQSMSISTVSIDGLLARGYIALYNSWDITAAIDDFRQAVNLSPNNAAAYIWLATALSADGNINQAITATETAVEIEPVLWYMHADLCWYYIFQPNPQRALDNCAGAVALDPNQVYSQLGLVEAYRSSNQYEPATKIMDQLILITGVTPPNSFRGTPEERFKQSVCVFADAIAESSTANLSSIPNYLIAATYAQCENYSKVSPWLKKALLARESHILMYNIDPRFSAYKETGAHELIRIETK